MPEVGVIGVPIWYNSPDHGIYPHPLLKLI